MSVKGIFTFLCCSYAMITDLLSQKSGSIYREPIFSIRSTGSGDFFKFSLPTILFLKKINHQWQHRIDNVIIETMPPKQTVSYRRRHNQCDGQYRQQLLVSQLSTFSNHFDVTVRRKVSTVKLQICVPSCRSESSNIQLGHIRQTGYKESVCHMISSLVFYFKREKQQRHNQIINFMEETMSPK